MERFTDVDAFKVIENLIPQNCRFVLHSHYEILLFHFSQVQSKVVVCTLETRSEQSTKYTLKVISTWAFKQVKKN